MICKYSKDELCNYLYNQLHVEWENYAKIIFHQKQGTALFYKWLKNISEEHIKVIDLENEHYIVIILYSYLQVRLNMIDSGLFSLRKRKMDELLQQLLDEILPTIKASAMKNEPFFELLNDTLNNLAVHHHYKDRNSVTQTMEDWLKDWIVRPHFPKYKTYYTTLDDESQEKLAHLASNKLFKQVHHPHVRRVYFRLLYFHSHLSDGYEELFRATSDPLMLTPEEKDFLQLLEEKMEEYYLSLVHHFIERLIEKRTRKHYHEAIMYIEKLRLIYSQQQNEVYFETFISLLQDKYERFTSFQKELTSRV
ncbi:hypothetical protein [Evansella cellulosilytica]|uniref:Uncharacterized protein n=1 Tax=Evansella cellulosilytica (strain ATCC 21833 / DSM 2522 / FERM P-1141 / JCM 9156 / N-4) TaxID=649639 RepID=E6TXZ2_EVAC2|nr:hypothetical protein [Evansella cellulosilytica]ADU31205.1 hypothetical protein Bcell_2954 [Evansella cellulosilytica DSM 2522]